MTYNVLMGTLNHTHSLTLTMSACRSAGHMSCWSGQKVVAATLAHAITMYPDIYVCISRKKLNLVSAKTSDDAISPLDANTDTARGICARSVGRLMCRLGPLRWPPRGGRTDRYGRRGALSRRPRKDERRENDSCVASGFGVTYGHENRPVGRRGPAAG